MSGRITSPETGVGLNGWGGNPLGGDAWGCSGSGETEAGVECPSSSPFVVGVLFSTGIDGSGSNSLIWSVSGDGAELF